MQLIHVIKDIAIAILKTIFVKVWVEIKTEVPACTYYFGPFYSWTTAQQAYPGYLADLQQEGAQGIQMSIKRCEPSNLTICHDIE